MSEKQLNDLPDEILLEVFKFLDFKSLLEFTFVCKRWNGLIGENSTIMKKIPLEIKDDDVRNVSSMPEEFTRNYQTVKIFGTEREKFIICDKMYKLFGRCVSHLRVLVIDHCSMETEEKESFGKILARMTKLETLRIESSFFHHETNVDLTKMNRLKTLAIWLPKFSSQINFPVTAQLTSLKIGFFNQSPELIIDFLTGQTILEELILSNIYSGTVNHSIELEKLKAMKFPLKTLLFCNYKNFLSSETNLRFFINKFSKTLNELKIEGEYPRSFRLFPNSRIRESCFIRGRMRVIFKRTEERKENYPVLIKND